ncbi:right-handed parallel beta-helix repeat-containing protein [Cupriavidus metallidurans]|uniref:right-handed parallel beta-helix repeat-containing protein n=1 Tax=Cupriavidus metallidurans TaxID=119219 RepID=UPI00056B83C3|nr:right-handed parallel beta-helix repeat-containing protein [Cupriavidus metallidurans]
MKHPLSRTFGSILIATIVPSGLAFADDCALPALDKDVTLRAECIYHSGMQITRPVRVDCNGATLEGDNSRATGILIDSRGESLQGVEIRNCRVHGFTKLGIGIGWSVPDGKKREIVGGDDPQRYVSRTPSGTHLIGNTIEDIGGVGIYIDDHATGTVIDNTTVQRVSGAGIYLEHDSSGTSIVRSRVLQSGWDGARPMQPGIAIDASADNRIEASTISGNGLGGVFLYRNCQERGLTDPESVPRAHGANGNRIQGNKIDGRVGVWVGSRMSRNMRSMQCGRTPYYKNADMDVVLDEARGNYVSGNTFGGPANWGMIVEDDDTVVEHNAFVGPFANGSLLVGTKYRNQVLNLPVRGTVLRDNRTPEKQTPHWEFGSTQ